MTEAAATTSVYGASTDAIRSAFVRGRVPVAVYGLGKMGLPLAAVFAGTGASVTGVDVDEEIVSTVSAGGCHVTGEPGLSALVSDAVDDGRLEATTDGIAAAKAAQIHVVIVPTPITDDHQPDLSILDTVVETIGHGLSVGDLVIIESTVPPGTTEGRVLPRLCAVSGFDRDDFGLAFCPERTSSGRAITDISGAYQKVVGGVDEASIETATAIYEEVNDKGVIQVSDATTAEAVKVFEGVYRDVNIALANELATLADDLGIDVREAIDVANTQPYCDIHEPGPGVGGHCIPYYPYFLIQPFDGETALLETARSVNDAMPAFTVSKLVEEFDAEGTALADATVAILGLTYRPGVDEIRASPSLAIAEQLSSGGATVLGIDPVVSDLDAFDVEEATVEDLYDRSIDAVVIVTPHDEFDGIDWASIDRDGDDVIVIDGRDSLASVEVPHRVYTLGRGHV